MSLKNELKREEIELFYLFVFFLVFFNISTPPIIFLFSFFFFSLSIIFFFNQIFFFLHLFFFQSFSPLELFNNFSLAQGSNYAVPRDDWSHYTLVMLKYTCYLRWTQMQQISKFGFAQRRSDRGKNVDCMIVLA